MLDEKLRQRAQRAVLERDEPDLTVRCGEFDGQHFDQRILAERFQVAREYDREKTSVCRQPYPRIHVRGVDCRARRLEPARSEGLDDMSIKHGSGRRPGPRLVHQLREPDLASLDPW